MKILVTGGGGFLGRAICAQLIALGYSVRSFNRSNSRALETLGVAQIAGDISNMEAVCNAAEGVDAIIHCAGKVGAWGAPEDYYDTNVRGTDNVLAACELQHVRKLVFTSSPSVVHAGCDLEGVDESTPYATHFSTAYAQTKAMAEQRVLEANGTALATVALRPHFIWGPGDPNLLPRVLNRARQQRLRLIGRIDKRIDTIYVENAALAHVLALQKLDIGAPIAGKPFFISQGEPVTHEHLINCWLRAAGLPSQVQRLPLWLARVLGYSLESVYRAVGARAEPPLTRFLVEQLSTAHWFNIDAARRELGYAPQVDMTEGLRRLTRHFALEYDQAHQAATRLD